jgi:hypothetical protein
MNQRLTTAELLNLEDVLGSLLFARRAGDLGRLALLAYCDVRRWARWAHRDALAEAAADLITQQPFPSRADFLSSVDDLITELEHIRSGQH